MRKYCIVIFLMFLYLGGMIIFDSKTIAENGISKELAVSQIKITGDEYVVLRNTTSGNLALGNFWLQYYNDFNLSNQGISNSSMQLPALTLQPGQEILLAVGAAANCGQIWVAKLSFSLKDSAGLLQIIEVSQNSGQVIYKSEDQVSWSSKTTDTVDIKGVSSSAPAQIWYKPAGSWISTVSPPGCVAIGATISTSTSTAASLVRSTTSPPTVVLGASTNSTSGNSFGETNAGLISPQISEVLPNPASPQTDATDEFIELYNPNNAQFDLSGFILRTGSSTYHTFSFPPGQFILQPHEFRAFFAPQTGISLSNTSGQAALLSPAGDVLAQTDIYTDAKDGYAWIYNEGLWQWTLIATPNSANVIKSPTIVTAGTKPKSVKTSSKTSKNTKGSVLAASTPDSSKSSTTSQNNASRPMINPLVLAVGTSLAVIYALYEYRHDLANQIYKYKRYRALRRNIRQTT